MYNLLLIITITSRFGAVATTALIYAVAQTMPTNTFAASVMKPPVAGCTCLLASLSALIPRCALVQIQNRTIVHHMLLVNVVAAY